VALRENYLSSKYPLRAIVPAWLSAQADLMRDFVRDADARRKDKIRYGESLILSTMTRTRNAITGRFEDALFAQLLAGAPGVPADDRGESQTMANANRAEVEELAGATVVGPARRCIPATSCRYLRSDKDRGSG
jgi:hypothetical protein